MYQQQQQSSAGGKQVCVISNCDSLLGYALAYRFLEAMQHGGERQEQQQQQQGSPDTEFHKKLRILCRDREGLGLKRLEEMGAEIHQVNYKDEEKIRHAMKDVRACILIPENSRDRLKEAENLMKCAKYQGVEHMALMSFVGVDRMKKGEEDNNSKEFRNFCEYQKIEKMMMEMFPKEKGCIVRHQVFNQLYYFMAPQIEDKSMLCLPVNKDAKWGTVNLNDVVEGVFCLAKKEHERSRGIQTDSSFNKQTWNFTAPRTCKTEEMVHEVKEGLGMEKLQYKHIQEDEFRQYLEHMKSDKRFKERPDSKERFGHGRDGWWSVPVGKFLNKENIETTMEYLRLACKGHLDYSSEDLLKVLDRNPLDLKEYFKINRDMFKRFK